MTLELLSSNRSLRRLAVGACALLCAAGAGLAATGTARPKPERLLSIASDEPLSVRFATAVAPSRVGSQSFRVVRESDGQPVHGRYRAGTFLRYPGNSVAVVVDPTAFVEQVMVVRGVDRDAATAFVERTLWRTQQTGGLQALSPLHRNTDEFRSRMAGASGYDPEIVAPWFWGLRSLPQQDASATDAARALRKIQSGDDALWAAYITQDDAAAFEQLAADPAAARFRHSIDPVTGQPRAESDFQMQEHRRCLFTGARTGRVFTFVPDVPVGSDAADAAFAPNERFRVTIAGLPNPLGGLLTASGYRAAFHGRVANLQTADPTHETGAFPYYGTAVGRPVFLLSELNFARCLPTDVTPPNGERLVDPTTDWENPSNRLAVAPQDRTPFVARVRFNQPLDPRTVNSLRVLLRQTSAAVGTPDEHDVVVGVVSEVRLRQTRLGEVVVEIQPAVALAPSAAYEILVTGEVQPLHGEMRGGLITRFTTAPPAGQ